VGEVRPRPVATEPCWDGTSRPVRRQKELEPELERLMQKIRALGDNLKCSITGGGGVTKLDVGGSRIDGERDGVCFEFQSEDRLN
jgi:hypothetical protein